MKKLSFTEYMDSKQKLREAIDATPQCSTEYNVQKYCKLIVGEDKDQKQQIALKPKQKIVVEWLYDDLYNPTPLNIRFEGVNDIDPENEHHTYWQGSKLIKWLNRNTHEI